VGEDLRDYTTVRRWISTVDEMFRLSAEEWANRLAVLDRFCSLVAQDPDRIIAESRANREAKNQYMRRLKGFVRESYPGARPAHDAENVVRSFFIHNGARVIVRPYDS
jgi:hypothetical protein